MGLYFAVLVPPIFIGGTLMKKDLKEKNQFGKYPVFWTRSHQGRIIAAFNQNPHSLKPMAYLNLRVYGGRVFFDFKETFAPMGSFAAGPGEEGGVEAF